MTRPRIGVTGVERPSDGIVRAGVNTRYLEAILAVGGLPIILPPTLAPRDSMELLNDCSGLLLTGGEDIEPDLYAATPHPRLGTTDRRRDDNELALIESARARRIPILGICRGIQILNVAFGGTLWQDLPSERPGPVTHDQTDPRGARTHPVDVPVGSRLSEILGEGRHEVNSLHHQGIRELGEGLAAVASSPDGLIEAVESTDRSEWLLGVAWHPEELARDRASADFRLFRSFLSAAESG